MSAKQLQPSYAYHVEYVKEKNIKKLFSTNEMIAQPKYDGERLLVHFDNGNTYCTTRRISKKTNRFNELQDNLPTFHATLDLDYTVLDGEIYSKDWATVAGITKSLPERSLQLQQENEAKYAAFDCLFFDGDDVRELPYFKRFELAKIVIKQLNKPHMHITESTPVNSREHGIVLMDEYISKGFEGAVLKHLNMQYDEKYAILKLKKSITVDCVVYDWTLGQGKYSETVGALKLGYYDKEKNDFVHITNCAPGTDSEREDWRRNWHLMKNSVVEVKCQELTKTSMRHPVIVRLRHDKTYEMCTRETIFTEEKE